MDEDSLSRDCEPFFESDGEEESTDGKTEGKLGLNVGCRHVSTPVCTFFLFFFLSQAR